jgi:MFS transporter, AAHS family, benzoate transport protein
VNATKWCDELKFNRFHLLTTIIAGLVLLFDGYTSTVIFFVIPHVLREWHLTPLQAGSLQSYTFVGLMVGAILFGTFGDLAGRKRGMIIGVLLFSLGTGFAYWAPSFSTLCFLRFVAGLGMGGTIPLTVALISEFSPSRVRAKVLSIVFAGFSLGPIIGGVIAIVLLSRFSWRSLFLVEFLALLLVPIIYWFFPESVRFFIQKGKRQRAIAELRRLERAARSAPVNWTEESFVLPSVAKVTITEVLKSSLGVMTILLWCTYFFTMLCFYGTQTWLPSLLMKAGHTMVRSYGFSLAGPVGGFLGTIFLGWLMDRFGRKQALVTLFIVGGVMIWLFGVFTSGAALYVIGFLIGTSVGSCMTGLNVVAGEIYPTQFRSTGAGWALTVGRVGAIAGPLLGGTLQMAGLTFSQFFVVFAIPSFVAAVLVFFFRVNVRRESVETVTEKLTLGA